MEDIANVYIRAQDEIKNFVHSPDGTDTLSQVSDLLEEELVSAINALEVSDDAGQAELEMRGTVHELQLTAFMAGLLWDQQSDPEFISRDGFVLHVTDEEKIELARKLLNGAGISISIE